MPYLLSVLLQSPALCLASKVTGIYTLSSGSLATGLGLPSLVPGTEQLLAIRLEDDRIKRPWAGLHQRPRRGLSGWPGSGSGLGPGGNCSVHGRGQGLIPGLGLKPVIKTWNEQDGSQNGT